MKYYRLTITLILAALVTAFARAQVVTQERMTQIYEEVKTPYKYGMVVAPADNKHKIDCPTVFREGNKWLMTYVVYNGKGGTDGRGYETWLAESDNLLEWRTVGCILKYRDGFWDANQRGGFPGLLNTDWEGNEELGKYKGKNWMTYIGGSGTGYEAVNAPLSIGLAWTSKPIANGDEWQSLATPLLSYNDADAQWWEKLTQYKSTIYFDKSKKLGAPFVMYYNAGGINPETKWKGERIGIALSKDMKKWKRFDGNPVFSHESSGTITGDAQIKKIGDLYVMFYFSAFNPTRAYKAYNTFACSYDLVHWYDWLGDDLIYPSKPYDELFAHKSYVIKYNGVVYHFYCAVNNAEQRGIAVATSKPMGKSRVSFPEPDAKGRRTLINLKDNWSTCLLDNDGKKIDKQEWKTVSVPHNWDTYEGARQMIHGNLHGSAVYRTEVDVPEIKPNQHVFIRLEGVGSYGTLSVNGSKVAERQPMGRVTHTYEISKFLKSGAKNSVEILAEHPSGIKDMPWVCGGCSSEWGFSEGSQPLGIFRPVVLEITDEVRVEPFGVHVWNTDKASATSADIFVETEVKNYSSAEQKIQLISKICNADGVQKMRLTDEVVLAPGETKTVRQKGTLDNPQLWSDASPYLYKAVTLVKRNGKTTDEENTTFGVRTISWPLTRKDGDKRFMINGKPVFIHGVCEYEHLFGMSHAFTPEQVMARVKQITDLGFNAFRDAHHPHNLLYQHEWDKRGIVWWPQFSAHIWYDTPAFRNNFKQLLRQWVKERRNSPSLVLWGLQNESTLPRDFAAECSEIIRQMDPTATNMRLITTCNGGEGTDWNVIQNWSGTYGGHPDRYDKELKNDKQLLNGEYGAWRTLDFHGSESLDTKAYTEDRACNLLELKMRKAWSAKDSVCGQFQWIYSSHDNPGRRQPDEALRLIDKVGPYNYKGIVTPWEEPSDMYYLYRAIGGKEPMVRIISLEKVYTNCDSVRLYNDVAENEYLATAVKKEGECRVSFGNIGIRYGIVRAVGYKNGKPAAEDMMMDSAKPESPKMSLLAQGDSHREAVSIKGEANQNYIYRINCGGDDYTDEYGQLWHQDNKAVSHSWDDRFDNLQPYLGSQRTISAPVRGTKDMKLMQTFRFGREQLYYEFKVGADAATNYRIELYMIEPWIGRGESYTADKEGLRLFDVAVNDSVKLHNIDLWAERGFAGLCKFVVYSRAKDGKLRISFPRVAVGEAVISAIAISADSSVGNIETTKLEAEKNFSWADADKQVYEKMPENLLPKEDNVRAQMTYEAEDAAVKGKKTIKEHKKQKGVFFEKGGNGSIVWNISTGLAQEYTLRFKYMNQNAEPVKAHVRMIDAKGVVLFEQDMLLPDTPAKWKVVNTTTGSFINAGHYKIELSAKDTKGLAFDALIVE